VRYTTALIVRSCKVSIALRFAIKVILRVTLVYMPCIMYSINKLFGSKLLQISKEKLVGLVTNYRSKHKYLNAEIGVTSLGLCAQLAQTKPV